MGKLESLFRGPFSRGNGRWDLARGTNGWGRVRMVSNVNDSMTWAADGWKLAKRRFTETVSSGGGRVYLFVENKGRATGPPLPLHHSRRWLRSAPRFLPPSPRPLESTFTLTSPIGNWIRLELEEKRYELVQSRNRIVLIFTDIEIFNDRGYWILDFRAIEMAFVCRTNFSPIERTEILFQLALRWLLGLFFGDRVNVVIRETR